MLHRPLMLAALTVAVRGAFPMLGAAPGAQPVASGSDGRASGAEAVVYIRVFGAARAEFADAWRRNVERRGVELATGSGFVIAPAGYILTNHHVVSGDEVTLKVNGRDVTISLAVERIEVAFGSGQRYDASVLAVDPSLDLAVLSLAGAADVPYMALGDSDAVPSGAPVTALGYPFGRSLEVGRAAAPEIVPTVTVTSGTVSSIRNGDDDEPRFLQVTNALNPGNSGGPLVDADGFAQGVVVMKVTKGDRIGFAIAINRAKDFLERNGLEEILPTRRLRLGPVSSLSEKGVRIRMPYGFEDRSPARIRIDAAIGGWDQLALHIDRVASPWSLPELERALLQGTFVETLSYERMAPPPTPHEVRRADDSASSDGRGNTRKALQGRASALDEDGRRVMMEYLIVTAGKESVLARYVGGAEAMALNLGVVRSSLESIDVSQLLWGVPEPPRFMPGGRPFVNGPINWRGEPGSGPLGCRTPIPSAHVMATSPLQDFTQSTRFAVWEEAGLATVLRACKPAAGEDGGYAFKTRWAGVEYAVEGQFLRYGFGFVQIELVVPSDRVALARAWLRDWRTTLEAR